MFKSILITKEIVSKKSKKDKLRTVTDNTNKVINSKANRKSTQKKQKNTNINKKTALNTIAKNKNIIKKGGG